MSPRLTWVSPDGGWGWVVVACSVVMHAQTFGILYSLGVLYVSWLEEFDGGRGATSWVISMATAVTFLLGPLPAALANLYGFRVVTVVGGLLTSAGFIFGHFATSIPFLIVSIGIVAGAGCCFAFFSAVTVVTVYFNKRRALAMGVCTSGVGIGVLISGPLLNHLINEYGWRGALLITGASSLHMCACGLLLRPLEKVEISDDVSNGDGVSYQTVSLLDLNNERHLDESDRKSQNYSLEIPVENENRDCGRFINMNGPALTTESIHCDVTVKMNQSNGSTTNSQSKLPSYPPKTKKASSMMKLQNGSFLSVNKGRVYCSLKDINVDGWRNHSGMIVPILRDLKQQHSLDVLFARSFKHISYRSLLGNIPDGFIKHFDDEPENNSQSLEVSHYRLQSDVKIEDMNCQRCCSSWREGLGNIVHHNADIIRDPVFFQFTLSNIATNLAFVTPMLYLVDRAVDSGLDKTSGALLVAMNGVGNIVGRLFFGAISYRLLKDSLTSFVAVLVLAGVSTAFSCLCRDNMALHLMYATLIGSFLGGYCTLVPVAVVDIMGIEKASSSFGLLLTFMGIASLLGPPFAGFLFDVTQNYTMTFIINGIFFVASALIILPTVVVQRKRRTKRTGDDDDDDVNNYDNDDGGDNDDGREDEEEH